MIAAPEKVEATALRQGQTPADHSGVGLYVGGSPEHAESPVGSLSGEVVWTRVVRAPILGRLRHPASVSLTFDDGPYPAFTPAILQTPAANHIHAVFCLIGSRAQRHPDLVRRLLAAGHVLCDHTQDHDEGLARRGARRIRRRHRPGRRLDRQVERRDPSTVLPRAGRQLVSPNGGGGRRPAHDASEVDGRPPGLARPGIEQITAAVLSRLRPGGVVLLHDGGGNRSQTADALPRLIETRTGAAYCFATP